MAYACHVDHDADLAVVASLIADRHRAQILQTLLSGVPQSGSALAAAVGISRSLASAHLKKLVAGGLVRAQRDGRQQLYSIASEAVASALEILSLLAPPMPIRSLRDSTRARSMRWARMCYDHIAGVVGVTVTEALMARSGLREVDGGWTVGDVSAFAELGLDVGALPRRGRPLARPCLDWSERRHHLAGSLGAALTSELVRRDWLRPREGSRIVTVTAAGSAGLRDWLGIDVNDLRPAA
jgi:DNA-binding transcriptional ArsR family regulator